jgi:predicted lipid-binding transport protein (Tim44 family)
VAKDIDEEQTQAKVLLLVIHRFIAAAAQTQSQPAQDPGNVESTDNQPLYAAGHAPQQQPQQAPQQGYGGRGMFGGGMMGGGMMMGGPFGGYMGGGFAQAMEMGAGMGLMSGLVGSIFRR